MRIVQFSLAGKGRRVGYLEGENILDLTSVNSQWTHVYYLFFDAHRHKKTIPAYLHEFQLDSGDTLPYDQLLKARPGDENGWILPPLDHPDPAHCLISGTGLTHLGSMEQRAQMHLTANEDSKTDSQKMFEMGLKGGKPEPGMRGIQPEWFYKGTGIILRGHNDFLDIPSFAEDGGEEPEVVGCYLIDEEGVPCRVGFAVGNEWSDHRMEKVNYLWLAHSKLRVCSVGPELVTDQTFKDLQGRCRILRKEQEIYNSHDLLTGEEHMSHSLANLEDHHFKHPQFRIPMDVHLHFFGTMKLSYPNRSRFETDDRIEVSFADMGRPLVNYVRRFASSQIPTYVREG